MKEFNNWFKDRVTRSDVSTDVIKKLVAGLVMTYEAYDINGYTFYTVE
jgi:hypothetical protein